MQKLPPEVLYEKNCSQKFHKIHTETPVPEPWYSCFPVNFAEFLRTPFIMEQL